MQERHRYPRRAKLPCKPEMRFYGEFSKFNIYKIGVDFRDRNCAKKSSGSLQRPDAATNSMYMSLICSAVLGMNNWACI